MKKFLVVTEHPVERVLRILVGLGLLSLVLVGPKTAARRDPVKHGMTGPDLAPGRQPHVRARRIGGFAKGAPQQFGDEAIAETVEPARQRPRGRNGDGNAEVGVSGIIPAPMTGTASFSAAEKPMNAARPATISPSLPAATSRTWRIQASAFSLAMRASACAVALRLFLPATTEEILVTDCEVPRMSPASAECGTPRSRALPNVPRSASNVTS